MYSAIQSDIPLAKKSKIVVAMSGGVDSSVCAALLKKMGYDVIGITLQLYDHGQAIEKKGACCAGQDIYDAKKVAEKIDIPHYILNYESLFKQAVIDDFADSYLKGYTPLPCVRCNQSVKFKDLFNTAHNLGAAGLATGHYVKKVYRENGRHELHRGKDLTKDQSYFLFATTKKQLDFLYFPLGGLDKQQTRQWAHKFDLPVSDKPDSQDICFVPTGSYGKLVEKLRPGAIEKGPIVDQKGHILGQHNGIIHYTIGQRRGLDLGGLTAPYYVIALRPETKEVVVGPKEALGKFKLRVKDVNWLADPIGEKGLEATAKFRSTQSPQPAIIYQENDGLSVEFKELQYGISPGQACVIYNDTHMLGGGWICGDEKK